MPTSPAFRRDHVGSLLRPAALAGGPAGPGRRGDRAGELRAIEDRRSLPPWRVQQGRRKSTSSPTGSSAAATSAPASSTRWRGCRW